MLHFRPLIQSFSSGLFLIAMLCMLGGMPGQVLPMQMSIAASTTTQETPAKEVPELSSRMQAILQRIKSANQLDRIEIKKAVVVEDPVLNAATDGQNIIFTNALWNTLKTDDQRAFVLSHELAHVAAGHLQKTAVRKVGLSLVDRLLFGRIQQGSLLDKAQDLSFSLVDMRFSRTMEYQADGLGIQLMSKAGYNTQGAMETLSILKAQDRSGVPQFLRTHPLSESRIQALSKQYKK